MSRDVFWKTMYDIKTRMGEIYYRLDATEERHSNRNYSKQNTEKKRLENVNKASMSLLYVSYTSINLFKNMKYDQYHQKFII